MSIKIALAGNPNCGKTTMFNDLTGSSQYVGNWPGVTVEKKEGKLRGHKDVIITDLPGIYSLSPYTLEEVVSRDYLLKEKPDAVINLVDGTNLERNLYLTTQILELGIPVVLAVNMIDLVAKNGDKINTQKLGQMLGCEVVEASALKGKGSMQAAEKAIALAKAGAAAQPKHEFSKQVEQALDAIADAAPGVENDQRWYAIKLFERDEKVLEQFEAEGRNLQPIERITSVLEEELDDDSESIITNERYEYIAKLMKSCVNKRSKGMTTSDKIDRIVTNRWLALPIFAAVMFVVYFISVSWIGTIVTDWTNDTFFGEWIQPAVGGWLEAIGAADWLNGLVVDGIIGGVGAVLGFVPQMFILFFFLSILEDCGYMARVAFIMDRIFRKNDRERKRPPHDGDDHHLYPLRREAPRHCAHRRRDVPFDFLDGAGHVLPRHCRGYHFRDYPQENKNVCGRSGSLCHGAAAVPLPGAQRGAHPHVGARQGVYYQSWYRHIRRLRPDLVPLEFWIHFRRLRHGGGD